MRNKFVKENGFSMLELLATILIISIVLGVGGYFILNVLSSSNDKVNTIAVSSLGKTSQIYAKEYPNEIIWHTIDNSSDSYTCIPISRLVNKGFLKENEIKEVKKTSNYIIVTRDINNNVINEELDNQNQRCGNSGNVKWKVPIPTSDKYCLNPVYSGSDLNLIDNNVITSGFAFEKKTGTNAGNYQITAKLNTGYVWYDDTTEDKTITCSIKKAKASLDFVSNSTNLDSYDGEDGETLGITEIEVKGNTSGNLSLKTSNKDIATAKVIDGNGITAEVNKKIAIEKIATRNALTYITITLNPNDKKNYYSGSIVYTIGKVTKKRVKKPNSKDNCSNPRYNGNSQIITKDLKDGYTVSGNNQINVGTYPITAKLKYGYMWEDTSIDPVIFNCEILLPTVIVSYDSKGGTSCDPKTVVYKEEYGDLCTTTQLGYTFSSWKDSAKNVITSTSIVENDKNHTLEADWNANIYTVKYHGNGATSGSTASSTHTYNSSNALTKNGFVRTGYKFVGWAESTTGSKKYNDQASVSNLTSTNNGTINLYAVWETKKVTVKFIRNYNSTDTTSKTQTFTYGVSGQKFNSGFSRTGYNALGWSKDRNATSKTWDFTSGVSDSWIDSNSPSITLYAIWEVKKITVTFMRNYNSSDTTSKTQTFTYGASGQSFNSGFSRTGYTPLGWSTNRSATSQTYSFKSGVSDDWINSNSPSITLYAIWRINVCTITYNPNGGKFNSNSNDTVQKMNYGTSTSNMRNASGGTYDATRSGNYSHIRKSVAWISSYDKLKYNQDNGYNATDFCPNLANGDQSVTLYVNWFKWQKRTWNSCKTGSNTCKGGNVCTGGWVNDCMSGYNSSRQCKTIEGSDATWISGTKQCCRSVWKDCASSYWDSCKTGSNTCKGGWNSWTNVNSCSESSKVECKRVYDKDQ